MYKSEFIYEKATKSGEELNMPQNEVIRCSKEDFERKIEEKLIEGYELKLKTERVAILEKQGGWGSPWMYAICLFFTLLLAWTVIWVFLMIAALGIYAYQSHEKERKVLHIKIEDKIEEYGKPQLKTDEWTCSCGQEKNIGMFCGECGKQKPKDKIEEYGKPQPQTDEWTCSSGHVNNTGKFCAECGEQKA